MDGRIFAVVMALIVTAAGVGTALYVLSPGGNDSDYTIIDDLMNGKVNEGLYYDFSYETQTVKYDKVVEVTKVSDGNVTSDVFEMMEYNTYSHESGADEIVDVLFDYTDIDSIPAGIVYNKSSVAEGTMYTMNGTGTVKESIGPVVRKDVTYEVDSLVITVNGDGECVGISGGFAKEGFSYTVLPVIGTKYYNGLSYSYSYGNGAVTETISGSTHYEYDDQVASDEFLDRYVTGQYIDYNVIIDTKDKVHCRATCLERSLEGTDDVGNVYNSYWIVTYKGYLMESRGVLTGEIDCKSRCFDTVINGEEVESGTILRY